MVTQHSTSGLGVRAAAERFAASNALKVSCVRATHGRLVAGEGGGAHPEQKLLACDVLVEPRGKVQIPAEHLCDFCVGADENIAERPIRDDCCTTGPAHTAQPKDESAQHATSTCPEDGGAGARGGALVHVRDFAKRLPRSFPESCRLVCRIPLHG